MRTRRRRWAGHRRDRRAQEGQAAAAMGGGEAWPGFKPTHPATHQRHSTTGVEGAGGSGGHGRASRSTTPSRQARVWRSRGRPGPTAPGTPVEPQATTRGNKRRAGGPPPTGAQSSPAPQQDQTAPGTPAAPHATPPEGGQKVIPYSPRNALIAGISRTACTRPAR